MNPHARLHSIIEFYHRRRRMPSLRELAPLWGFQSKTAADKVCQQLLRLGVIAKDRKTGELLPTKAITGIRRLGVVGASFPSPAEEELGDVMDLDEYLVRNKEATFMLEVSGDSMIEAGLLPGDLVLVQRGLSPKDGDIVIARIDHGSTLKYFRKRGRKVYLEPANKKYQPFYPTQELIIEGVVIGSVRKY
jgi:SOS regulatory protein LexA